MAGYETDLQAMQQAATRFDEISQRIHQTANELQNEANGLLGSWQGQGASKFQQVMAEYGPRLQKLKQELSITSQSLGSSGQNYGTTDDDQAAKFNQLGGGAGMPLPL